MASPKILFCTSNSGKVMEAKRIIQRLFPICEVLSPKDINLELDVVEDGTTLAENSRKKLQAYMQHDTIRNSTSKWIILADDTGLEIEALEGISYQIMVYIFGRWTWHSRKTMDRKNYDRRRNYKSLYFSNEGKCQYILLDRIGYTWRKKKCDIQNRHYSWFFLFTK